MPTLPTASALAVLLVLSGIAGVVAADPTNATTTAVEQTAVEPDPATARMPAIDGPSFEERLAERLGGFDLTDGQIRTIVNEAVRLRDDGASRLVVRSSIVMNLYGYGVDAPFLYAGGSSSPGERIAERLGERFDLTDDQVAEIAHTIDRLHADGASRVEIYRAVRALLVEYGVDEDEVDALTRRALHAHAHRLDAHADRLHDRAHRVHHRAAAFDRSDA